MVWDVSTPTGAQPVSSVDDYIRELKTDLMDAFRAQLADGVEASFPGPNTSAPEFHYRGKIGSTVARPASGNQGLYFDQTRQTLQRDNGTTWDDIATNIPAGTVVPFYQAAAPVGWTKLTTVNDMAIRVVSGSGGVTGGTLPLSGGLVHTHTIAAHNHSIPAASIAHQHQTPVTYNSGTTGRSVVIGNPFGAGASSANGLSAATFAGTQTDGSSDIFELSDGMSNYANGNTGLQALTSDSSAPVLAYADVILASKN